MNLQTLIDNWAVGVGSAVAALALAVFVGSRLVRAARGRKVVDVLSNVTMVVGLGWSSEAMWEIADEKLQLPLPLTLLLFFVFEAALLLSMLRAQQHVREHGWPGRFGSTAWGIASLMGVVAATAAGSLAEAVLRLVIPLVVTKLWWDGLVGGAARKPESVSSWRWTPRRMLLWLGAIEPGERDVETVHRERLIQQMTRLKFLLLYGAGRLRARRTWRLMELTMKADDEMIAEVEARVSRVAWVETGRRRHPAAKAPRVVVRRSIRLLRHDACVTDAVLTQHADAAVTQAVTQGLTQPLIPAAAPAVTQDVTQSAIAASDAAAACVKEGESVEQAAVRLYLDDKLSSRQVARTTGLTPSTVQRLGRKAVEARQAAQNPSGLVQHLSSALTGAGGDGGRVVDARVNGHVPAPEVAR